MCGESEPRATDVSQFVRADRFALARTCPVFCPTTGSAMAARLHFICRWLDLYRQSPESTKAAQA
jgi:hypothetical protein